MAAKFGTMSICQLINDKIEIGLDEKKLIDGLSKKVIKDFIDEYEKLSSLSRESLEPVIKSLIDKHIPLNLLSYHCSFFHPMK